MTTKPTPKPGEVWTSDVGELRRRVVNVYPDCLTYVYEDEEGPLYATTIYEFAKRCTPPAPTVDVIEEVWLGPHGFYVADLNRTQLPVARKVGTIAAMSDGTFRFEAA